MNLVCLRKPKSRLRSPCWRMRPGTIVRRMCRLLRGQEALPFLERFPMRRHFRRFAAKAQPRAAVPTGSLLIRVTILAACLALLTACSAKPDPNTLVMIIESSPTNLDPRVGLDAYSERIDTLLFDDLLTRNEHLNVQPQLAESWDIPDPKTYIFHLHH